MNSDQNGISKQQIVTPKVNDNSEEKRLDTLILSLISKCNLKCNYCHNEIYYRSLSRPITMSLDLAQKAVRDYAEYLCSTGISRGTICLTGGEPLLVGPDYLKKLFLFLKQVRHKIGVHLQCNVQTNGTLLDNSWCDLFIQYKIGIGLSVDGHPDMTDKNRIAKAGTFLVSEAVARSANLLTARGIPFGVLLVVTSDSVGQEFEILRYLQKLNPETIAFTPCIDKGPIVSAYTYSQFVTQLFDEWINCGKVDPEIRMFKYCRQRIINSVQMPVPCEWGNDCPNTICVSADGKVWVCDVYMGKKEGNLGDVSTQTINEIVVSNPFRSFVEARAFLPKECVQCDAFEVCNGGCVYRRANGKDYLCDATLAVYNKMRTFIERRITELQN